MPFRNASATLPEALDSIFRQSMKEFELSAVNDGSEDNGAAIIETAGDNRLRLLHNPGSGLVNALNFGISQSKANWIVRMDAIVPTHLAFEANSREEVEAFYQAALAAGATDNGGPGYRDYWPGYYAAFVYDPDGHNIEAVWYDYSKVD